MSSSKRSRLSSNEIEQILEEEDSDNDRLDLESSSSQSSSNYDEREYLSSDSEDDIALPTDWTASGRERNPFTFRSEHGVKFAVEDKENPVEFFENYFDEEVVTYLVTETNRFAQQFQNENIEAMSPQSRVHKWYDTSANEMKVFIGLLILQGIDSKVESSVYFSSRESVASPFFRKIMSGRRFGLLHKFLHLVDNETITDGPGRKVAKIKPFIDLILKKFKQNYVPNQNVSIDESLLGWKGNLSWVQYIPAKRKRFGMKFFELCAGSTEYIWNFFVYAGSDTSYMEKYMDLPVTSRIVLSLMDPLLGKGYCLYTDNFYTSPTLADKLVDCETDTVGTVRVTRKDVPAKIKEAKLKKGETVAAYRKKVNGVKMERQKGCVCSEHVAR